MSSCLLLASCKQRLAQVGTCLVTGRSLRASQAIILSVPRCQRFCTPSSSSSLAFSRQLNTFSGPLLSRALVVRRGRAPRNPDEEYRQLVEEASGVDELMEEVKESKERPVITVPVHLEKRLGRRMEKESTKGAMRQRIVEHSRMGNKKKIIIRCKRPEFNYYHGQSYHKEDVPLASEKWRHRQSSGDFFTLFPGFKRDSQFFMKGGGSITFNDLGICQALCDNLTNLGIKNPTHIQVFGIPQLLKGGYNIVAAETGCGKTFAYLLPIIHQILEEKRFRLRQKPGHPSTVILLPSRELADQIFSVAKQLTYKLDVSVKLLQGGNMASKLNNPPEKNNVDILITTTNALKVLTAAGVYGTGRILHVVLDEADTLLDDSFFPELVGPFLNRLPWNDLHRQIQLTLVCATMPKGLQNSIGQIVKVQDFSHCTTPGLHYSMPHVPQDFLRLRKSHKPEKVKELIKSDLENKDPVLIFCNKAATCTWLEHYLNDLGLDCAAVHGRMPLKYRKGRIDMYQSGELNVLISTDLASRGIDTVRTQHVINYEFPLFMADYIHRCGRTGRVGSERKCRVTNFITRPGEIEAVQNIERSVRKERALPDVNANIKRLYGQKYGSFVEIQPIQDDEEEPSSNAHDDDVDGSSDSDNHYEGSHYPEDNISSSRGSHR